MVEIPRENASIKRERYEKEKTIFWA